MSSEQINEAVKPLTHRELFKRAEALGIPFSDPADIPELDKDCHCRRCDDERGDAKFASLDLGNGAHALMNFSSRFYLCETCGCKRCPHATDHRYACTNSNEPGQEGSIYG